LDLSAADIVRCLYTYSHLGLSAVPAADTVHCLFAYFRSDFDTAAAGMAVSVRYSFAYFRLDFPIVPAVGTVAADTAAVPAVGFDYS